MTCYLHKYSVVPTAQGDSLVIAYVIHDLINERNVGHKHHLLGQTILKKRYWHLLFFISIKPPQIHYQYFIVSPADNNVYFD